MDFAWAGVIGAEGEGRAGGQVQEALFVLPTPAPPSLQLPSCQQDHRAFPASPGSPRPAGTEQGWRGAVVQAPVVQVSPQPGPRKSSLAVSAWTGRTEASPAR